MLALSRTRFITGFTRSRSSKSPFTAPSGESIGTMNKVCALKLDTAPLSRRDILLASLAALTRAQARSRIRLGCQTRAYGSPLKNRSELLAALADLHDLGYEGFETNFASLADSFADPLPARAEIALRGLPLIGLHISIRRRRIR